eukprot:4936960-Alexandrium_andersonii.AAC.1
MRYRIAAVAMPKFMGRNNTTVVGRLAKVRHLAPNRARGGHGPTAPNLPGGPLRDSESVRRPT